MSRITYTDRELRFAYANVKFDRKRNSAIRLMASCFLNKYQLTGRPDTCVFINSTDRQDYAELVQLVYDQCEYDKSHLTWIKKRQFNIVAVGDFIRNLAIMSQFKSIAMQRDYDPSAGEITISLNLKERFLTYCLLVRNHEMKRAISKYDWGGTKMLVSFYDIGAPEHFVVNSANDAGVKTVVLQHGIFPQDFLYDDPNTYNMYKVPSKYFLSLGRNIVELINMQHLDTKVIVCGQPRIRRKINETVKGKIGIACSIPACHEDNVAMINIAEKYAAENGMRVSVRLHPTDDESNYALNQDVSAFDKGIENSEVILVYNSSMLFTYIAMGKKVLRYDGKKPYYSLPDCIEFKDYKGFKSAMEHLDDINYETIAKRYIDCIGTEADKKYHEAFKFIYEDN